MFDFDLNKAEVYPVLPYDTEVTQWFEENIDSGCSASSAIFKFRLWLKERAHQSKVDLTFLHEYAKIVVDALRKEEGYDPTCCDHKNKSGLSAFDFIHEETGHGEDCNYRVAHYICLKCGTIKIAGHRDNNHFNELIDVHLAKHVAAIVKLGAWMNEGWFDAENKLPYLRKEDIKRAAWKVWEEDQLTNPTPVNPHAFVYGFNWCYRLIRDFPLLIELLTSEGKMKSFASFEGKAVCYNKFSGYDGCHLDNLQLAATLRKKEDFEELIKFLQINQHCFKK